MIDAALLPWLHRVLAPPARALHRRGIGADQITLAGFALGLLALPALAFGWFGAALVLIGLNRVADGLDGMVARLSQATDRGAFLDICLDFIFYSAVVFGFALADPGANGLAAAALIFSFVGTGSSFLAFAIMAERRSIANQRLPTKGFYYLGGLAEGTETILFLALFCLFPAAFPVLAWIFACFCMVATVIRIVYGYNALD